MSTGFIYHIRPSANFYDVNGSLRQFSPNASEAEFAALAFIGWNQVIGWEEVQFGNSQGFINNPSYRPELYPPLLNVTGIDPLLARFPPHHPPWRTYATCTPTGRSTRSTDNCAQYSENLAQQWAEALFYRNYKKRIAPRIQALLWKRAYY